MTTFRAISLAVICTLSAACSSPTDSRYVPLKNGTPILTSLVEVKPQGSGGTQFSVTAFPGQALVKWEGESAGCLIASASAVTANGMLEITVARSGNPLANCIAGTSRHSYVISAQPKTFGTYQVRLVDSILGTAPVVVGTQSVTLQP